jgi:hypothetical protein
MHKVHYAKEIFSEPKPVTWTWADGETSTSIWVGESVCNITLYEGYEYSKDISKVECRNCLRVMQADPMIKRKPKGRSIYLSDEAAYNIMAVLKKDISWYEAGTESHEALTQIYNKFMRTFPEEGYELNQ